jgi:hypothetical protein
MKFYVVEDAYIAHLKKVDSHVPALFMRYATLAQLVESVKLLQSVGYFYM